MSDHPRPVTIRDIAASCGLSTATISLALRNHPSISKATRERVAKFAAEMGYRANPLMAAHWETVRARKPATFQAIIAVINDWETVPQMQTNPWLAPAYAELTARASALGYGTEEFSVAGPDHATRCANLSSLLKVLHARGVYAIAALFSAHPGIYVDLSERMSTFASVFIGAAYRNTAMTMRDLRHIPYHRVNPDYYGNMLMLLESLKAAGYERPGFWPNSWAEARIAGEGTAAFNFWIQSLPASDQIPVKWTRWKVDPPLEEFRRLFLRWLTAKRPDVVICQNFEVKEWIGSLGLDIPRDIGLVHTDLGPPEGQWSGIDCQLGRVAAAGIDLLTAHLHRNERGIPATPKDVRIEGVWAQGKTTRRRGRSDSGRHKPNQTQSKDRR